MMTRSKARQLRGGADTTATDRSRLDISKYLVPKLLAVLVSRAHEVSPQACPTLGVCRHRTIHVSDGADDGGVKLLLRQM